MRGNASERKSLTRSTDFVEWLGYVTATSQRRRTAMSKQDGFSARRDDAVDGGGIEGALATMDEVVIVDDFTYGGKFDAQVALKVTYDIDGMERPWEQNYTFGKPDKYEVLRDGDGLRATGKKQALNKKSVAYVFFSALEDAAVKSGLDFNDLTTADGEFDISPLRGRQVRLTNTEYETAGGDKKEAIVIDEFVGDAPKAKGKTAATKPSNVEAKATAAIERLIEEHTSVKLSDLATQVLNDNRKDPDAKAMMQLALKKAWVEAEARPWTVTKGVLRAS